MEIIGVAGTGKSTLARALVDRDQGCRIADFLHTRSAAHWRYVAHGAPRVLGLLAATVRARPAPSWDEVKLLVYVSEWSRYLAARPEHRSGVVVLDQGPLFALACLLWGGNPATEHPRFRSWVTESVAQWSAELGLIVWLDASDEVLLERIDDRAQRHEAKGRGRDDALGILRRHRAAYDLVVDEISRLGHPPVRRLDTSTAPPEEIAAEVRRIFDEMKWLTNRGRVSNVR